MELLKAPLLEQPSAPPPKQPTEAAVDVTPQKPGAPPKPAAKTPAVSPAADLKAPEGQSKAVRGEGRVGAENDKQG
jgi:hypothetical protein